MKQVDCCVAAVSRKDHKHSRRKLQSDIAAYLSKENEFEWNPHSTDDISVAKELVSMHNQKFKTMNSQNTNIRITF